MAKAKTKGKFKVASVWMALTSPSSMEIKLYTSGSDYQTMINNLFRENPGLIPLTMDVLNSIHLQELTETGLKISKTRKKK